MHNEYMTSHLFAEKCPSGHPFREFGFTVGRQGCACSGSVMPGGHHAMICDRCGGEAVSAQCIWAAGDTAMPAPKAQRIISGALPMTAAGF